MSGNVWEWTRSLYQPYPYEPTDGRETLESNETRPLRGGSWLNLDDDVRCAVRYHDLPPLRTYDIGFWLVLSPGS